MSRQRLFPTVIFLLSIILFGFLPQTGSSSKKKTTEPEKDTTWLTYVEQGEYSFQYPKDWELEFRWKSQIPGLTKNLGFEILSLRKHATPYSKEKGSCGLDPNSAKIILSIQPKDSSTIDEIAHRPDFMEYEIKRLGSEKLKIDGQNATRVYYIYDGYHFAIDSYFDYKDGKYAFFGGMFGNGNDSASLTHDLKRIQNSFKILK